MAFFSMVFLFMLFIVIKFGKLIDIIRKTLIPEMVEYEGHFTHWKEGTRFFQNKRIYTDFLWIFLENKRIFAITYSYMLTFPPISLHPLWLWGGGGGHSAHVHLGK